MDGIRSNFVCTSILTRFSFGLLLFRKKHRSGAIVRFSDNSSCQLDANLGLPLYDVMVPDCSDILNKGYNIQWF